MANAVQIAVVRADMMICGVGYWVVKAWPVVVLCLVIAAATLLCRRRNT